jgi:hypothetical protein
MRKVRRAAACIVAVEKMFREESLHSLTSSFEARYL